MKTGIMGGTFNPLHNAHLLIAEMAMEEYGLDRVIFITGGNPPHKEAGMPSRHRYQMTHIAINGNDAFEDDAFEINRKEKSYSVNTLRYLTEKYPADELFFIIGEDSLSDLTKWYKPEEILSMCTLLVFPRKSKETMREAISKMRGMFGQNIFPINAPIIEISSTDIRNRLKAGKTVRYMIPDCVLEYIKEHKLYGE